jgi:hypothetical protein
MNGQMVVDLRELGLIITCMVKVYTHGKMVDAMKANMLTIKRKVTVFILG